MVAGKGSWELIDPGFNDLPVHTAMLHTGRVLGFGGSGNDEFRFRGPQPFDLFDPSTRTTTSTDPHLPGDVFCAGHSFLADGRLLVAGGTHRYDLKLWKDGPTIRPFLGLDHAYLFDPATGAWSREPDMRGGRWYPSCLTLADGRVLCVAGLMKGFPWAFRRLVEIYEPGKGWRRVGSASRWLPLYPHLHLLPEGDVFYTGSYNTHYDFPFTIKGFPSARLRVPELKWSAEGSRKDYQREEGASVLLPLRPPDYAARILMIGGALPGTPHPRSECELIDFSGGTPTWTDAAPMKHARYYAYATLLPDGKVFVLGGRTGPKGHHGAGDQAGHEAMRTILEPELYEPGTGAWEPMAEMSVGREYHSSALLLPDGRVIAMGSNIGGARRKNELRIEIYSPPYIGAGDRPEITHAPTQITPGAPFEVGTADPGVVDQVVLVRQGSTTHCVNTDQRLVELRIAGRASGSLTVELPRTEGRPGIAPPGYWMLFLLRAGVPSVAKFVRIVV